MSSNPVPSLSQRGCDEINAIHQTEAHDNYDLHFCFSITAFDKYFVLFECTRKEFEEFKYLFNCMFLVA